MASKSKQGKRRTVTVVFPAKEYDSALKEANVVRALLGAPPMDRILPGVADEEDRCPIAQTIKKGVKFSSWGDLLSVNERGVSLDYKETTKKAGSGRVTRNVEYRGSASAVKAFVSRTDRLGGARKSERGDDFFDAGLVVPVRGEA